MKKVLLLFALAAIFMSQGFANNAASMSGATTEMITVSLSSSDAQMGSVMGGGEYPAGTPVVITAVANVGYQFLGWSDGVVTNPRTITSEVDVSLTAVFAVASTVLHTVGVYTLNSAMGTTVGSGSYHHGCSLTIAAMPNAGYAFEQWQDGSLENPRTVQVNGDLLYVASFTEAVVPADTVTVHDTTVVHDTAFVAVHDTVAFYDTVTLTQYDTVTLTQHDTVAFYDTITLTQYDTVTLTQHDTVAFFDTVTLTQYDTVTLMQHDTVAFYDTVTLTQYDTVTLTLRDTAFAWVHDTVFTPVHDTTVLTLWDTAFVWVHDTTTVTLYDTVVNTLFDTVYTTLHDTTLVTLYDTIFSEVHDTTFVTLYDTIFSEVHDTTVVTLYDTIINTLYDTTFVTNYDTVYTTLYDTIVNTVYDTIIRDIDYHSLVVVTSDMERGVAAGSGSFPEGCEVEIAAIPLAGYHFSHWNDGSTENPRKVAVEQNLMYVANFSEDVSIDNVTGREYTVTAHDGFIVVNGAEGQRVRVFDSVGRLLLTDDSHADVKRVSVSAAGTYLVQVGSNPAQKVAYVR